MGQKQQSGQLVELDGSQEQEKLEELGDQQQGLKRQRLAEQLLEQQQDEQQ